MEEKNDLGFYTRHGLESWAWFAASTLPRLKLKGSFNLAHVMAKVGVYTLHGCMQVGDLLQILLRSFSLKKGLKLYNERPLGLLLGFCIC